MSPATELEVGTKVLLDGKPGTVIARKRPTAPGSETDHRFFLLVARPSGTEIWVPETSDRLQPPEAPDA